MRLILCAALVCSGLVVSAAQSSDQEAAAKPAVKKEPPPGTLHSVIIKGNSLYSSQDIGKETGLKSGQRITGAIIEQARLKLQGTELFNNVSDSYRFSAGAVPAYDVTFEVAENEQVFPMRFERIGVTPEAARQCGIMSNSTPIVSPEPKAYYTVTRRRCRNWWRRRIRR